MIILKNTTEPQDVMLLKPYQDSGVKRSEYLKSSDLKTLNDESLVGQGNISIPVVTKTSDLVNDSGFIDATALDQYAKKTEIPTKTSQLTNDSGYLTEHQSLEEYYTKTQTDTKLNELKTDIPTKTSQLTNDSDYTTKSYVDSAVSTALGTIETKLSTI